MPARTAHRFVVAVLAGLLASALATANEGPSPNSSVARMLEISRSSDVPKRKLEALRDLFGRHLAQAPVAEYASTADLRTLFLMADILLVSALAYSDPDIGPVVGEMDRVFQDLRRRGAATNHDATRMLGAYLSAWQLDKAEWLRRQFPDTVRGTLPRVIDESSRGMGAVAALFVSQSAPELHLRDVDLRHGTRIVVVSGCGISRKAAYAIDSHPDLRKAFLEGNALWLAPASTSFDFDEVQQWNREFPRQPIAIAHDNAAWKAINFSRIPTFYFFKDGVLVSTVVGWPAGKGKLAPAFLDSLVRVGLLPAAPLAHRHARCRWSSEPSTNRLLCNT